MTATAATAASMSGVRICTAEDGEVFEVRILVVCSKYLR